MKTRVGLIVTLTALGVHALCGYEMVPPEFTENWEEPVLISLPATDETSGLRLGDGVSFGQGATERRIAARVTSVFATDWLAKPESIDLTQPRQQLVTNFIEDLDVYELTRKSALAINVSAGGFWGSASASFNESKFHNEYRERLTAQAYLQVMGPTRLLRFDGNDTSILNERVQQMVVEARAAKKSGEATKLQALREMFRKTYGTCYVANEQLGARLVLEVSQKLDTQKDIEKQKTEFRAASSGLGSILSDASVGVTQTKEKVASVKKSNMQMRALLQGGSGRIPVAHDQATIIRYVNEGAEQKGWAREALDKPPKLTSGIVPYTSVEALSILAYPSGTASMLEGSRELDSIFPILDGVENKQYAAVATFLQYATGFGAVRYALVPIPQPTGTVRVEPNAVTIPVQIERLDDPTMQKLRQQRWREVKQQQLDQRNKMFFEPISSPDTLESTTVSFEVDLDPSRAPLARLTLRTVAGGGDRGGSYPPSIQTLYNSYPKTLPDQYYFQFKGTNDEITAFQQRLREGVQIRPVLEIDQLQQIRLGSFTLKIDADGRVELPKRIEAPESSQALRRLQELADSTVARDMLRKTSETNINAQAAGTLVAHIPGDHKIRVIASGKYNIHDGPPKYGPEWKGGSVRYSLTTSATPAPARNLATNIKAAEVWEWENKSLNEVLVYAACDDGGNRDNNRGGFKLDIEMVPRKIPFRDLPEDLAAMLATRAAKR